MVLGRSSVPWRLFDFSDPYEHRVGFPAPARREAGLLYTSFALLNACRAPRAWPDTASLIVMCGDRAVGTVAPNAAGGATKVTILSEADTVYEVSFEQVGGVLRATGLTIIEPAGEPTGEPTTAGGPPAGGPPAGR